MSISWGSSRGNEIQDVKNLYKYIQRIITIRHWPSGTQTTAPDCRYLHFSVLRNMAQGGLLLPEALLRPFFVL